MSEGRDTERNVFRKRDLNSRDVKSINLQLADEREKQMGEYNKPVTAEDIKLDVEEK